MTRPSNFHIYFVTRGYHDKLDRMLKPLVFKFRPHLLAGSQDIAKKQVAGKLKTIVGKYNETTPMSRALYNRELLSKAC